jgi:hypothetical protein
VATVRTGNQWPLLAGEIDPVDPPPDSLLFWIYFNWLTEQVFVWNPELFDHRWLPLAVPTPPYLIIPDAPAHPPAPVSGALVYRFPSTGEIWIMGPAGIPKMQAIVL